MQITIKYKDMDGKQFSEVVTVGEHWTEYYVRDWFFNMKDRAIDYSSIRIIK